jgi:2-polyprenyl-3-methyl-5-hydroxy-6-metoxy-1,4-benzoquinol methylase
VRGPTDSDHRLDQRVDRRVLGLAPGAPAAAAGQDARKYATRNPVVQRLIARWLATVSGALGDGAAMHVDVGVGEGLALQRLVPRGAGVVGIEYRLDKVRVARSTVPGLAAVVGDAGTLPVRDGAADLVTCIEVLEHLTEPAVAVAELARIARGRCVVSVPWEPWFRVGNLGRGKNVRHLGNDPEHLQAFTPRRLAALMRPFFGDVRVIRAFPWLVAVGTR